MYTYSEKRKCTQIRDESIHIIWLIKRNGKQDDGAYL